MTNAYLTEASHINTLDLVHRRLGHLGVDLIKFMSERDCYLERGFRVNSSDFKKVYCK